MYRRFFKSFFDFIFALLLFIIALIPMIIIGIAVKVSSNGPIFYRQVRVGKDGKLFRIFKFRTMIVDADKKGEAFTAQNDWRITKVGKFLRNTSLDEIPQIINILKGEMSFIGPRPWVPEPVEPSDEEFYKKRTQTKPGITGYAQIMGRSSLTSEQKRRYEIYYVDNLSFELDFKIVLKTIGIVLMRKGVN